MTTLDPRIESAIRNRAERIRDWMADEAPYAVADQRHLDAETPERAYWHFGYQAALQDILNLAEQCSSPEHEPEKPPMTPRTQDEAAGVSILDRPASSIKRPPTLQETFNLEDGPVTFSFPATISADSYKDLEDRLAIILRQMKRRVNAEAARQRLAGLATMEIDENPE